MEVKEIISQYRQRFLEQKKDTAFIQSIKDKALDEFQRLGFPDKKSEKYKYTLLSPFFENALKNENSEALKNTVFAGCDYHTIELNNGKMLKTPAISKVIAAGLKETLDNNNPVAASHFSKVAFYEDGLIALNTMFFTDGLFLHIPSAVSLDKPIQIISTSGQGLLQSRNLIVTGENVQAEIILIDQFGGSAGSLSQSITEVVVGKNSNLKITRIQNNAEQHQDISHVFIQQEAGSVVRTTSCTFNGMLVRNNMHVLLNGEGADHVHNNLFITDGTRLADNYIFVHHRKPHCTSNQLIKGILKDKSNGVFNGKILVDIDAQKTSAYQKNSNILLSSDAKMNTRPQLEIYADDVKCSHGATIGQLDSEALFYMRSRGVGEDEARSLLIQGFADEIIRDVPAELKEILSGLVSDKMRSVTTGGQK